MYVLGSEIGREREVARLLKSLCVSFSSCGLMNMVTTHIESTGGKGKNAEENRLEDPIGLRYLVKMEVT